MHFKLFTTLSFLFEVKSSIKGETPHVAPAVRKIPKHVKAGKF